MRRMILVTIFAIVLSIAALAQEDQEGCKDHPLFSRMPNYYLSDCLYKEFDLIQFPVGVPNPDDNKTKLIDVEGKITALWYSLKEGATPASGLQIMRNYQNAVKNNGGSIESEYKGWCSGECNPTSGQTIPNGCTNWSTTMKFVKNGKEVWVYEQVTYDDGGAVNEYAIVVAERQSMKQEIKANEMFDALNKEGFIALYINFETGKADIKPESQAIIDQIVQMLKENPTLKISIEGHTDNVGTPQSNQKLSEDRAKAVMNAIIAKGINSSRLSSKGWGQTKPIADNRTEEGRAKNRRVEIVKQ